MIASSGKPSRKEACSDLPSARELIHAYLDETLADDEFAHLASQLAADPELVNEFVATAVLHDHLRNDWRPMAAVSPAQIRSPKARPDRPLVSLAVAAAMLLAVGTVVWQAFRPSPASAALVQLQRIVAVSLQSADRTYSITAEDDAATTEPGKPEIDGARLLVRMPNSYVLVRQYDDGTVFTTGCDGLQSWSIPPLGRVRVSPNVERFRVPYRESSTPSLSWRIFAIWSHSLVSTKWKRAARTNKD